MVDTPLTHIPYKVTGKTISQAHTKNGTEAKKIVRNAKCFESIMRKVEKICTFKWMVRNNNTVNGKKLCSYFYIFKTCERSIANYRKI